MMLGRTRAELLYGSAAFRPISSRELTEWVAFIKWRNGEIERQRKSSG